MLTPSSFRNLLLILRVESVKYGSRSILKSFIKDPRFRVNLWLRVGQYLYLSSNSYLVRHLLLRLIKNHLQVKYGFDTTFGVEIGPGLKVVHLGSIIIHGNSKIGCNFTILNNVNIGQTRSDPSLVPVIGDDCYVGAGAKIIGGIHLGRRIVVGCLTLVNKDFPDDSVVAGIPGKVLNQG